MTIEQILEAIENMKVLELNELVKAAEEKFGVSASAPVMMAGAAAGDVHADRGVQRLHDQIRSGSIYNDGVLFRHDDLFDDFL